MVQRGLIQALFIGVQWQDKRQCAQTGTQDVPSKHQEFLLYCVGDGALAQISHRGYGVSFLGELQKVTGHKPGVEA